MTDAPKTIWTCTHVGEYGHYFPDAVEAEGEYGGTAIEYRRDDLPPTPAQIMADPRVQAVVDALEHEVSRIRRHLAASTIAALYQLKEPKP